MPLTDELITRANTFDIPAVADVLTFARPAVHRITVGLTGDETLGSRLTKQILQNSLRFVESWRDAADVERWFHHQAILATRAYTELPPPSTRDALLPPKLANDPRAIAFIKALRSLSPQQREAWLLTHCEQMPPRPMATAMDFSLDASATHLAHAVRTLKSIAGDDYASLELAVATRYAALTPAGDETVSLVTRTIRRHVWPRRLKAIFTAVFVIGLLLALAWGVWKIYPMIDV